MTSSFFSPWICIQGKDGIKGQHWLLEKDLKEGVSLRLDKSSRATLIILRQLGRLQEVRCSVEGVACTAYVLISPPTL